MSLIPKRPLVDSLTDLEKEIITGHLLGDGGLNYYENHRHKAPHFSVTRATYDRAYLEWSCEKLSRLTTDHGISDREIFDSRTKKTYYASRLNTRMNPVYFDLYNEWYPHGKKVVPTNLILTPLMIAIWLADDGNVRRTPNKRSYDDIMMLKLSTDSFPEKDTRRLASMLSTRYGEYFGVYKSGNGFNIQAAHKATRALVDEIDPYWPEGIDRKAYWRTLPSTPIERKPHRNATKTHCPHGHEYTEENTYRNPNTGHRACRTCHSKRTFPCVRL